MRVAVVGAGPAGLYFARLLKRARPATYVRVLEQGPEGATWGFGVGLGGRTMREVAALDQDVHGDLIGAMVFASVQNIHLNGENFAIEYGEAIGAIARLDLLAILTARARDCGVVVDHDIRVESAAELAGYDLIVAADGINSGLRQERGAEFGTRSYTLSNHFAWYGVETALQPNALVFRSIASGDFCAHYYACTPTMSTFVAECDDATWRRAGMDAMDDVARRGMMEDIFAPELGGRLLVDNRSVWRRFPVVTNDHWFIGNMVLIGDGLQSAHFSIGSGTRLAMDDAAALSASIEATDDDLDAALPRYVASRKPSRDLFGEAARRSFDWYEDMGARMRQPLLDFIHDFLTRTGRIDDDRLRSYAPAFHAEYRRHRARVAA